MSLKIYASQDWVEEKISKIDIPEIPTKTSDLTNDSGFVTEKYVDGAVSELINSAPETLNTLNELAAALGEDPNFATTITNQIGQKANDADVVKITTQNLTDEQKLQARTNIGAISSWNDLNDRPFGDEVSVVVASVDPNNSNNLGSSSWPYYFVSEEKLIDEADYNVVYNGEIIGNFNCWHGFTHVIQATIDGVETEIEIAVSRTQANGEFIQDRDYMGDLVPVGGVYMRFPEDFVPAAGMTIEFHTSILNQLDEKFIPDTIARVSDIDALAEIASTGSWEDLIDKPFGFSKKQYILERSYIATYIDDRWISDIEDGTECKIVLNDGEEQDAIAKVYWDNDLGSNVYTFYVDGVALVSTGNADQTEPDFDGYVEIYYPRTITTIDVKFIPDTIAKKSDIPTDNIRYTEQDLTDEQKAQARANIDAEAEGSALEALIEAKSYTDTAVAALVNSAPETLDTLGELAAAFEENADMVATLDAAVTNKAEKTELESAQDLIEINAGNISSMQTALNKYSTETWTFTLDNGSTVTKKMVISS